MTEEADKRRFRNRLCILRSIDRHEVPGLTDTQWQRFRDNPYMGFLQLDDDGEAEVWAALRKREPTP